jgi:hypothetical protein
MLKTSPPDKLWPALIALLVGVSLFARLYFVFAVSEIQPVADTEATWVNSLAWRDLVCESAPHCDPQTYDVTVYPTSLYDTNRLIFLTRTGISTFVFGSLLTVLPTEPESIYCFYILLDTLVILMSIHLMRLLGMPWWAICIGVLIQAVYIPVLIGTGTLLQQPFIRFALVLALWGYALAFAKGRTLWFLAGTVGAVTLGFINYTNRPLMWLLLLGMIILSIRRKRSSYAILQAACIGLLSLGLAVVMFVGDFQEQWKLVYFGLGDSDEVTTPISFEHFWAPDNWWHSTSVNQTDTLFQDFREAPVDFLFGWNYSLAANWQYPDTLYFQKFVLGFGGQHIQHILIVVLGLLGLAWLAGRRSEAWLDQWFIVAGIALVCLYVTLSVSLVSVEPRRVAVLLPFLAMGGAGLFWSLTGIRREGLILAGGMGSTLVLWLLPFDLWSQLVSAADETAYLLLVLLRVVDTIGTIVICFVLWRRSDPSFQPRLSGLFLVGALLVAGMAQLYPAHDWRTKANEIEGSVEIALPGQTARADAWQWLVLDAGNPDDIDSIFINGTLVKSPESPLWAWRTPSDPNYSVLFAQFANTEINYHTWLAYPLSPDLLTSEELTVRIEMDGILYGDYGERVPSPDPVGYSIWRWQWNTNDPRILSWDIPKQSDYRVYLVQANFGPEDNRLLLANDPLGLAD